MFRMSTLLTSNAAEDRNVRLFFLIASRVSHPRQVTISCSRALPDESTSHVRLRSIHFTYNWIPKEDFPSYAHIFSQQLFLPFRAALDEAVSKAVTNHIVARYPMVFGPWCKRFDKERSLFPSVARSLQGILSRSPNATFRKRCKGLLKQLRIHTEHDKHKSIAALNNLRAMTIGDDESSTASSKASTFTSLEDSVCLSLERIFRAGVRPARFKVRRGLVLR
ncbi:hypothetical protein OF83DRAFT_213620 [Amylostereum chailletii]|nr:hypothetical protein OF83DRAFT_213620 [Amylostereum chailletii]